MDTKMKRRKFLSGSVTLPIVISGCADFEGDGYGTLQSLVLVNEDDEGHTIELRMKSNGGVVHQETYELEAGLDGTQVDCTWPNEPLQIMIRKANGRNWNYYNTKKDKDCILIICEVTSESVSFFKSEEDCPHRSADC